MPLHNGARNDILSFAAAAGANVMAQAEYAADAARATGNQSGIARSKFINKTLRQAAHMSSGLAQFIANRYTPGVIDDGDPDKVEQGLLETITALIQAAIPPAPDRYDVCRRYYWFEDAEAMPGMFSCLGGVVQNISRYPKAIDYFQSPAGQARLVTQAEYDALHVAIWHTNADGTTVGWNGIGGVNKFVWDKTADTLRLPDLAGMTPEQIGCDTLGVGGTHGDGMRNIKGAPVTGVHGAAANYGLTDPFYGSGVTGWFAVSVAGSGWPECTLGFDPARVVPTATKNQPRAWGSLACVYLGQPAS